MPTSVHAALNSGGTAPCIELPGKLRLQIYEQSAGETANLEALDAFVDDGVSLKIDQLQGET